jgi:hypothetical protein
MAANLAAATAAEAVAIAQGAPPIPQAEADRRRAICEANACGAYRKSDQRCAACGCPTGSKARWRSQSCPRGLW